MNGDKLKLWQLKQTSFSILQNKPKQNTHGPAVHEKKQMTSLFPFFILEQ